MIGDRAVDEAVARHRRDPGDPGELEHHVGPSLERVGIDLLDRIRRSQHRLHPLVALGPDVAAAVAGVHQVRLALRPALVGAQAAIDQSLRALDVAAGEQHRRAQAMVGEGRVARAVEVGRGPGRLAALAQYAAGSKPSANAAVTDMHSTRYGSVHASAKACTLGVDLGVEDGLDAHEVAEGHHRLTGGKADVDDAIGGDAPLAA